ncbi:helix-turn-helix transcriptional regulator [Clostridium perfringens]|uniref:helix-turn-helix domain-containing protein n=1 Tax=Clostridium perfringens TaxID=1502 RepID=UPI000E0B13C4|nr:helix-turn-helix transcriptional regulator [Clostridium perfringens]AXH51923.1 hypothetical protein C8114_04655 [Clostridium perfringens]MBI6069240.1 helix-turn-helix transcriptional regulator [Clostridium perfringens]MBI6096471.1 helix-turn-helix transcriptional regulator [Clostridium perfringens]MCF2685027.1 helix-turn-helix transcriptional regulator [Clostridium perfringens]MCI5750061.1 helix-turn-helix domain-containing protein [Clostridium perfringens]
MNVKFYDGNIERIGYDFYCDIAINIVNERKALGLTQEELAEKTKIKINRLSGIENVKYRIKLDEIKCISKVLDVSVNNLINAELDSQIGECIYVISTENSKHLNSYSHSRKGVSLYFRATSKRMAFLKCEKYLNDVGVTLFSNSRSRVFVELVGKPITKQELQDKLPKFKENQEIEKDD